MKIVILDETSKRKQALIEKLEARGHTAIGCRTTGDFMDTVVSQSPGKILVDSDSWRRGAAMFRYFGFGKRMAGIPVIVYNAPESFTNLPDRPRHDEDIVLNRGAEVELIVDGV